MWGGSRAPLCVCACAPLKAFKVSCNCQNVTVFSRPGRYFWFPRLINQSVATKPNCNQHQNARRVRARWKGDNNNLVAQEWRRGFGRRRTLIRKQRCVRRIFVALVFFNFICASPLRITSSVCAAERWERRVYGTRSSRTESITTHRTLPVIR